MQWERCVIIAMLNSPIKPTPSHTRVLHCGRYTMKTILILILLITIGCGSPSFPKEFCGNWEFDTQRMFKSIEEDHWSEEYKLKSSNSYGSLYNGHKIHVSKTGFWKSSNMPEGLSLQLSVVKNTNGKYIFQTTNSMNPSVKEYSLNHINKEGIWCVEMIDSSMKIINQFPNNYWRKTGINRVVGGN
jgi:hypothetical protein